MWLIVEHAGGRCAWFGNSLCTVGGIRTESAVSVPERFKGVDSSFTVFALVGSNPTADMVLDFLVLRFRNAWLSHILV